MEPTWAVSTQQHCMLDSQYLYPSLGNQQQCVAASLSAATYNLRHNLHNFIALRRTRASRHIVEMLARKRIFDHFMRH